VLYGTTQVAAHDENRPETLEIMAGDNPLLEARKIARRHPDGGGWLLHDVSLSLSAGDRVSLAGPSGAGKTLLLRALAMLDPIDQGAVCWRGRAVRRDAVPGFRRHAIYLHQRAALLGDSVEEALRRPFTLAVHRDRQFDPDRAAELLGQLGRDPVFLGKKVGDLSGGEIQITALVRALQLDPTVLLLDEPTAALDPDATRAVEAVIEGWVSDHTAGRAYAWVSHDTEQAARMGTRRVVMEGGRIAHE
jgi:putative ABC transport system ATP-binding protein